MKVKAIEITAGAAYYEEDMEKELQKWLDDNPAAKIEHVVQTDVPGVYRDYTSLLTTIFYRD